MAKEISRLSEIFEYQRRQGKGTLGALGGTFGKRSLEILDVRNLLFGSSRTTAKSLSQQIGRSIFGAGYSGTPRISKTGPSDFGETALSNMRVEKILSSIDSNISGVNAKMTILAKNTIQQNRMARDINVIRQNVVLLTKDKIGSARTKADMYFMRSKQREAEYERKIAREPDGRDIDGTKTGDAANKTKRKTGSNFLKGLLAFGGILGILGTLDRIGESLNKIKDFASSVLARAQSIINSLIPTIENFFNSMKDFDFMTWIKSIDQEKIAGWASSLLNSIIQGFASAKDFFKGVIEKIPDDVIGSALSGLASTFLETMKFVGETVLRGLSTLSAEQLGVVAAASAIFGLLFGGGPLGIGIVGVLIKKAFGGVAKLLGASLFAKTVAGSVADKMKGSLGGMMGCCCDGMPGDMPGKRRKGAKGSKRSSRGSRGGKLGKIGNAGKTLGKKIGKGSLIGLGAGLALDAAADYAEDEGYEQVAGGLDIASDAVTGASIGATIGSVVPGVGTAIGGVVGGAAGALYGLVTKGDKLLKDGKVEAIPGTRGAMGKTTNKRKSANSVAGAGGWRPQQKGATGTQNFTSTRTTNTPIMSASSPSNSSASNVIRVQNSPSGLPQGFDYDMYTKRVGQMESGNDYGIVNTIGYAGRYQFGAAALETLGFMKPGSSKAGNKSMNDPRNWNNGLSLEKFLSSPEIQDDAMRRLTAMNYKILSDKGTVNANMSSKELSGWLYVAHGVGAGGAIKFSKGENPAEGYGTTASQMFAKASGLTHPGDSASSFSMSPFKGGMAQLASTSPSMNGGMFNMNTDKLGELGDTIVNMINNSMSKGQEVVNEALSSVDMDSIKDMFNPMIARATYGFTL